MHRLKNRIDVARLKVGEAEERLGAAIRASESSPRAQKVVITPEVRAAFSKLRAAKAKLGHLEGGLSQANLEAARAALTQAEQEFDRVVDGIGPTPENREAWIDLGIEDALEKVRAARQTLAELDTARLLDEES